MHGPHLKVLAINGSARKGGNTAILLRYVLRELEMEGIETEQQLEYMRQAGVELAQGYLFSRPVPASELDFTKRYSSGGEREMVA